MNATAKSLAPSSPKILRPYDELPYGTRFVYLTGSRVFVKLPDHQSDGCGIIARWLGYDSGRNSQGIFTAEDSPQARKRLIVQVIDNSMMEFQDHFGGLDGGH